MTPFAGMIDPSTTARDLLNEALAQTPAERRAFLDRMCVDNAALRAELEELLTLFDRAEGFLESPPVVIEPKPNPITLRSHIGSAIGRYKITRLIASGGMGSVYEALQDQPRRVVALKLMKQEIASRSALRRFEYESQILGRLRHPGIAQIFEAGMHHDETGAALPYFVMEYIPNASSITDYATRLNLDIRQRLALFVQVCQAVHHGHQKGIVHRDLKPGNILVDSTGHIKVIDFGVARATDSDAAITTLQTEIGQLIGTLQYMSPEQCTGDVDDIDTRSDVYALGVVLYELLLKRPPYELARLPIAEAARVIRERSPDRPSSFDRKLRGDLETIVLKAMEKDRVRRYDSAADLGDDVGRYLRNEPIAARPASLMYQLRTFARRNRTVVAAVAILIAVLALTTVVVSAMWLDAERERAQKVALAHQAIEMFTVQLSGSIDIADRQGNIVAARALIEQAERALDAKFEDQPELLVQALFALGSSHSIVGDFESARQRCQRALHVAQERLEPLHELTGFAHMHLAVIYRNQTDHARAQEHYRHAIETFSEKAARAAACSDLADMHQDLGQCGDAERLAREALAICRQFGLGCDYYHMKLAGVLCALGNLEEADSLLFAATSADSPSSADSLSLNAPSAFIVREQARLRLLQGRFDEARRLQNQALARTVQQHGQGSPEALMCIELGALIDLGLHDYNAAERGFASAADRAQQSLRTEHKGNRPHAIATLRRGRANACRGT